MRDHVVSLSEGDTAGLSDVARRYERFDAVPLAREAWCHTSRLAASQGELVTTNRSVTRSDLLFGSAPHLATQPLTAARSVLTRRELEVSRAAARGSASKMIAASLYLSARTVDNHLRSVYRKLGVSGRDELAAVLFE